MLPKIEVTAGLICDGSGRVLTAQRPEEKYNGLWEFPGGKIEPGESAEACLQRELAEELGIESVAGQLFLESEWLRPDKIIVLKTFKIQSFTGDIEKRVHADLKWQLCSELETETFLPADRPVVDKLISEGLSD